MNFNRCIHHLGRNFILVHGRRIKRKDAKTQRRKRYQALKKLLVLSIIGKRLWRAVPTFVFLLAKHIPDIIRALAQVRRLARDHNSVKAHWPLANRC